MHGCRHAPLLLLAVLVGCHAQAAPDVQRSIAPSTELAATFDAAQTGTLTGTVLWNGEVPRLPPLHFFATPTLVGSTHPHPHLPQVDSATGGLRGAIVYLRGLDLRRCRPWYHGPVRVNHQQRELAIVQDGQAHATGFVRRGSEIEVVNRDTDFHSLRGRGAAFFCLPLADTDVISRRRMEPTGVIELSSAAGFYWMHAHLFVDEHPYYCRTDGQGRFALEQVPAGTYEVVCWLPHWHVLRRERDPETGLITRLVLAPPREQRQTIHIAAGQTSRTDFTFSPGP